MGIKTKAVVEYHTAGEMGLKLGKDAVIKTDPTAQWRNVGKVLRLNPANGAFETQSAIWLCYTKLYDNAIESLGVEVRLTHKAGFSENIRILNHDRVFKC